MKATFFTVATALPAIIHAQIKPPPPAATIISTITDGPQASSVSRSQSIPLYCGKPDGSIEPCCTVDGKLLPCTTTSATIAISAPTTTVSTIAECIGPNGGFGPCCKVDGKLIPCFWTSTTPTPSPTATATASVTTIVDCIGPNGGHGPCCKVSGKLVPCFWTSTTALSTTPTPTPTPTPSEVTITTVITLTRCPAITKGPCETVHITTCIPAPPVTTSTTLGTSTTSCNGTVIVTETRTRTLSTLIVTEVPTPTGLPGPHCRGNCTATYVPTGGLPHTPTVGVSPTGTPPPYLGAAAEMVPRSVEVMVMLLGGVVAAAVLL